MQKPLVFVGQNKEACFLCYDRFSDRFWEQFWSSFGGQVGLEKETKTGQDRPRQSKISQVKLSQVVDVKSTVNYKEKCSPAGRPERRRWQGSLQPRKNPYRTSLFGEKTTFLFSRTESDVSAGK